MKKHLNEVGSVSKDSKGRITFNGKVLRQGSWLEGKTNCYFDGVRTDGKIIYQVVKEGGYSVKSNFYFLQKSVILRRKVTLLEIMLEKGKIALMKAKLIGPDYTFNYYADYMKTVQVGC